MRPFVIMNLIAIPDIKLGKWLEYTKVGEQYLAYYDGSWNVVTRESTNMINLTGYHFTHNEHEEVYGGVDWKGFKVIYGPIPDCSPFINAYKEEE